MTIPMGDIAGGGALALPPSHFREPSGLASISLPAAAMIFGAARPSVFYSALE